MGSERQKALNLVETLPKDVMLHSYRVAGYMVKYAVNFNHDKELFRDIGLLHDVGKYYISDKILDKPGRLTKIERSIIDKHAFYGYQMLKDNGFPADIYIPALYHHGLKPVDGNVPTGTPLQREYAKILQVADEYDALLSERSYKDKMSAEDAANILFNDENLDKNIVINGLRMWRPDLLI